MPFYSTSHHNKTFEIERYSEQNKENKRGDINDKPKQIHLQRNWIKHVELS